MMGKMTDLGIEELIPKMTWWERIMGRIHKPPVWTLDTALPVIRLVEDVLREKNLNAHAALAGGVMYRGDSHKDLDIIIYPRKTEEIYNINAILTVLVKYGFRRAMHCDHAVYGDGKYVVVVDYRGKRVDFIFVKG